MTASKRFFFLIPLLLLLILTGCGANVDQTIEVNPNGSGLIKVIATESISNINQYTGGIDKLKKVLYDRLPAGWNLDVATAQGTATFTITSTFQNADELKAKFEQATESQLPMKWNVSQTPFYRRDQLQSVPDDQVWAAWGVAGVKTLTNESVVNSVHSFVNWPGTERGPVDMVHEQRGAVEKMSFSASWNGTGLTRTVEILPAQGTTFQPIEDWLKAVPEAKVSTKGDGQKTYVLTTTSSKGPWSAGATVTKVKHNLFWDRVVIHETNINPEPWVGPTVPVKEATYSFTGQGWWSKVDQGPPKWYRFPHHSDTVSVADLKTQPSVRLIGYSPRVALYVAWIVVPVLVLALLAASPFIIRYLRKRLPQARTAINTTGGSPMTPSTSSFCSNCGKPLNGKQVCECGAQVAAAGAQAAQFPTMAGAQTQAPADGAAPATPPVGLWVNLAWQRLYQVLGMSAATVNLPIQASLLSMIVRAIVIAAVCHFWLNSLTQKLMQGLNSLSMLFGSTAAKAPSMNVFGGIFLALLVAAALSVGFQYLWFGPQLLPYTTAVLADAQWPVALGMLASWLLTGISPMLGAGAALAGVIWGQAVLSHGLSGIPVAYRKRVGAQILIALITAASVSMILNSFLDKATKSLF